MYEEFKPIPALMDKFPMPSSHCSTDVFNVCSSSPTTSEPLWYATASRKHVVGESLSKDRGLDRSADDFGFSAAKMRVEVRLQHRLRVNPNLAIEKSGNISCVTC